MLRWGVSTLLVVWSTWLFAGGPFRVAGAAAAGMAGTSVASSDVWSVANNPAAMAYKPRWAAGLAFDSYYVVPQYGLKMLALNAPVGGGAAGMYLQQSGYKQYSESRINLAFARRLSDFLLLGVAMDVLHTSFGEYYGNRTALLAEVGMMVTPNDRVSFAAHLYNPTRSRFADFQDERIPTCLRLGGGYRFSNRLGAQLEAEKDIDLPMNLRGGLEYMPLDQFTVRIGYASAQSAVAMGLGFAWHDVQANVAAMWNQNVGYSACVGLVYAVAHKKRSE